MVRAPISLRQTRPPSFVSVHLDVKCDAQATAAVCRNHGAACKLLPINSFLGTNWIENATVAARVSIGFLCMQQM